MLEKKQSFLNLSPASSAGMLSHQLHRDTIDGDKVIIQNPTENQRKETPPHTFEMYDVFAVDVIVSTGERMNERTYE